jgi:hypothetical protein
VIDYGCSFAPPKKGEEKKETDIKRYSLFILHLSIVEYASYLFKQKYFIHQKM